MDNNNKFDFEQHVAWRIYEAERSSAGRSIAALRYLYDKACKYGNRSAAIAWLERDGLPRACEIVADGGDLAPLLTDVGRKVIELRQSPLVATADPIEHDAAGDLFQRED